MGTLRLKEGSNATAGWQPVDLAEDRGAADLLAAGAAQAGAAGLASQQQLDAVAALRVRGRLGSLRHRRAPRQRLGLDHLRAAGLAAAKFTRRRHARADDQGPQAVHHLQPRVRLLRILHSHQREPGTHPRTCSIIFLSQRMKKQALPSLLI